ncbi:MAG: sensor domain-containing diguanylate cyclase [Candidatus Aminicenantes bacterium]|jgi:diguanylate cyclase (GGDEF)-like protein/PAS domain S-box-containing protein
MPAKQNQLSPLTQISKKNTKRYLDLLEHLPVGVYRTTPEGKIIEANPALVKMLGYDNHAELKKTNVKDLYVKAAERARYLKQMEKSPTEFSEFELCCKDGRTIWCRDYTRRVTGTSGKITHYDGILVDVTKEKKDEQKLKKALHQLERSIKERKVMISTLESLSLEDPLTGLYNRRGFTTIANQYLQLANRKKEEMFLLFIDLDNLKGINDSYGHNKGDKILISLAEILIRTYRKSDIKARIGGDEFAVFPIEAHMEGVKAALARMNNNIDEYNAKSDEEALLSVSTGVARYNPLHPCAIEDLLTKADKQMYLDKRRKEKS